MDNILKKFMKDNKIVKLPDEYDMEMYNKEKDIRETIPDKKMLILWFYKYISTNKVHI